MPFDPDAIDVLTDVTYAPDIKGPALAVCWREAPMGFIRPLKRVPGGANQAMREAYEPNIGK